MVQGVNTFPSFPGLPGSILEQETDTDFFFGGGITFIKYIFMWGSSSNFCLHGCKFPAVQVKGDRRRGSNNAIIHDFQLYSHVTYSNFMLIHSGIHKLGPILDMNHITYQHVFSVWEETPAGTRRIGKLSAGSGVVGIGTNNPIAARWKWGV